MTKPETALYQLLSSLRVAFFDWIWGDAFPWIESIWIKESDKKFHLFVETSDIQPQTEMDDLDYSVDRILRQLQKSRADLMPSLATYKIEHTIQYGPTVPKNLGYEELMTDWWFKKIAKMFSPGRLERGR